MVPVALGVILGAAALTRLLLTRDISAPWIMIDELYYSELAKSFAATGDLLIREYPTDLFTLYSVVISPAWWAESIGTAYAVAKAINVALMTLAAVPVFFWARRVTSPLYALVATVLTLSMPAYVFTGMLMTENAFFPAFVLATFLMALTLERPTLLRQGLLFAAIAIACLVRVQAVVLFAMLPLAIVAFLLLDLRSSGTRFAVRPVVAELRRYRLSLVGVAVLAVGYVLLQLVRGVGLATGLGAYRITGEANYSRSDAVRWVFFHLAELGYSVGILPVCALIVCFGLATRRKADFSPAERAFLAVAASSLLLVVQVAVYASRFTFRIEERNMFHIAPILFIGLAVWLSRGLPRPAALTAVAVLVPAALLVTVPLESLLTIGILSDTFALIPLLRLTQTLDGGAQDVRILLGLGLIGAGVLFAGLPRRWSAVFVPVAVVAFLFFSSVSTFRSVRFQAAGSRAAAGPDASWIDEAIGTEPRVGFLYTPEIASNPHILWQTEFWNRAIGPIYQVETEAPANPGSSATIQPATGRVVVSDPRGIFPPEYAVSDADAQVVGDVVATSGTLALTRISPPLRLVERTQGIYNDGWMGADASYTYYAPPDGTRPRAVQVSVSRVGWSGPDVPGEFEIRVGRIGAGRAAVRQLRPPIVERRGVIQTGAAKTLVVPVPPPPFRVELHVAPTFSPADFGQPDVRQLGAHAGFEVLPQTS